MNQSGVCPFVSCQYHLLVDITDDGKLRHNFKFDEDCDESIAKTLIEMPATCALDIADQGENDRREVARLLNLKNQAIIEHIEVRARYRASGWNVRPSLQVVMQKRREKMVRRPRGARGKRR